MAERAILREPPNVHDIFQGGLAIQNSTLHRRARIKELVVALQNDVQLLSGEDVRVDVTADIKINIAQPQDNQHLYHLSVSTVPVLDDRSNEYCATVSSNRTALATARERSHQEGSSKASRLDSAAIKLQTKAAAQISATQSHSDNATNTAQAGSPDLRPASSHSLVAKTETHPRPNKRPRTNSNVVDLTAHTPPSIKTQRTGSAATLNGLQPDADPTISHVKLFLEDWRKQWHSQGGYLYDQLSRISVEQQRHSLMFDSKLDALQTTVPAANSQVLAGLADIRQNMIPWLERCRKADADSSQAREEKWRASLATFHDQARKERNEAEDTLLKELRAQKSVLDKQTKMISKLMKAKGSENDVDAGESSSEDEN